MWLCGMSEFLILNDVYRGMRCLFHWVFFPSLSDFGAAVKVLGKVPGSGARNAVTIVTTW